VFECDKHLITIEHESFQCPVCQEIKDLTQQFTKKLNELNMKLNHHKETSEYFNSK
jgi:hypothetical protein